jgi:putative transposase
MDAGVDELAPIVGRKAACAALGRSRASHYRARRPPRCGPPAPRMSHRRLGKDEAEVVIDALNSERFCDRAPAQVWATLLDEGVYLASISTMYRLLRERSQVRERRAQARRPAMVKPELVASAPNQVWSWDITKLAGPYKWTWFQLYTILDVYSRYAVGWLVAPRESATLAEQLIADGIYRHEVPHGQLTLHADRGSSMTSRTVSQLLCDLGVLQSHSRPHVSNDNPYSESQFKTLKYSPTFPKRFANIASARSFCDGFFQHYNHEHRHSGIGLHTPADVHFGMAEVVREKRQGVLDAAFETMPGRFRRPPQAPRIPEVTWINRPEEPPIAI